MKKVTIANMNIEITMIDNNFLNNRMKEYENNNFKKRDMLLKTIAFDEIKKPTGNVIKVFDSINIVQIDSDIICRYITDKKTGEIVQAIYYNHEHSYVEMHLIRSRNYFNLSLTEFEYLLTGIAFGDRLAKLGGMVLHGSSIAYQNQGIIFSANCGTGKSTHTNLWKECYGDEITIVNDDKPAIRFNQGTPFVFGTPWSGKSDLNSNIQVPLKAIVFLKQSNSNWIESLSIRDCVFNLASQTFRAYYEVDLGQRTFEIIEGLVKSIPMYMLHCNISTEAVGIVYNKIIKRGENL